MEHNQGTFEGAGGMQLFYQRWCPQGEPKAVLAIVHGLGEHSGRYMNVVQYLVPRGYAVYGFDHRGHGRSPGRGCHIISWEEFRRDVKAFLETVQSLEPSRPVFLYGHSMGSLIVIDYVIRHPQGLQGAIFSGAPIEPIGVAGPAKKMLARLLSRFWPGFTFTVDMDSEAMSRDPAAVQAYNDDPLNHKLGSARWGTEALETLGWVTEHARDVRLPVLMVHGGGDRINTASGSQKFFDAIDYPDKELIIYPGSYHEVHNDLDHALMARDLERWLEEHF
jgi:alpha-beta hydrolase superfamily lysophospholipase